MFLALTPAPLLKEREIPVIKSFFVVLSNE